MTSLPAEIFGIHKRGYIAEGYFADLVLLDIKTITNSEATLPERSDGIARQDNFGNPHKKADGIEKVWVNGKLAYKNKTVSKKRSGRMLI